jgi:hypothetical protein
MDTTLPPGVTRCRDANPTVTLENCHAVKFFVTPKANEVARGIVVWRDGVKNIRPVDASIRLSDMRPGCEVFVFGKRTKVVGVEIYR